MARAIPRNYTFLWEGKDKSGRVNRGEVVSINSSLAKAQLRKQGIDAFKVKRKSQSIFGKSQKRIRPLDIAVFTRQLATMLKSGVPMVQAFDISAEGTDNVSLRNLAMKIKQDISSGNNLSSVLRKHPKYFDELFCNLVAAGEQSGTLDKMLDRIATYKERMESLKGKIKKALFYPATVLFVALIITIVLLVKVVPEFESIFKSFGAELPMYTQFVIDLSRFAQAWWWMGLLCGAGLILGFSQLRRKSPRFAFLIDKYLLKMPIIGKILHKAALARFSRTLATTFTSGVPLVEGMESVAGSTGNQVYANVINSVRESIATGQQLHFAMRTTNLFPSMVIQMIAVGEESGSLDDMLNKVADYYEEEVNNAVDNLTSLIEPIVMLVLGILVGGLVLAMYMPIFKMASVI